MAEESGVNLEEFYAAWERQFRGQEPPILHFLERMKENESSSNVLAAMAKDLDSLETQKSQLERRLGQIQFCLWWINQNRTSLQDRDSGLGIQAGGSSEDEGSHTFPGKRESQNEPEYEGGGLVLQKEEVAVVKQRRRKRSQSMIPTSELTLFLKTQQVGRRGSFGGAENDYENMSQYRIEIPPAHAADQSATCPSPVLPQKMRSQSVPVERSRISREVTKILDDLCENTPLSKQPQLLHLLGEDSQPVTEFRSILKRFLNKSHGETNTGQLTSALTRAGLGHLIPIVKGEIKQDDIYDRIPGTRAEDRSEVADYLCTALPAKEASAIASALEGTKLKVTKNSPALREMVSRWLAGGKLRRILELLEEQRLYDIHRTVETLLREEGTIIPPSLPRSPRPSRKSNAYQVSPGGGSAGSGILKPLRELVPSGATSLIRSATSKARLSSSSEEGESNFRFGIRITADYVPAGVRDSTVDGFRSLAIVRGQLMDVIGSHDTGSGELYVARNEEGEIGLVSPGRCEVLSHATPIIWSAVWFVTDTNSYVDKLRYGPVGTFYIRSSVSNPGDLSLVVNIGSQAPTKFWIVVKGSTYTLAVGNRAVYFCKSIMELINHFKEHSLPMDNQQTICLTVPCKKLP